MHVNFFSYTYIFCPGVRASFGCLTTGFLIHKIGILLIPKYVCAVLVVLRVFTKICVLPCHGNKLRHDNHPPFIVTLMLLNLHVLVYATADITVCSGVSGCTCGGEQHFILVSYRNIIFKTSFLLTPVSPTKLICAERFLICMESITAVNFSVKKAVFGNKHPERVLKLSTPCITFILVIFSTNTLMHNSVS